MLGAAAHEFVNKTAILQGVSLAHASLVSTRDAPRSGTDNLVALERCEWIGKQNRAAARMLAKLAKDRFDFLTLANLDLR